MSKKIISIFMTLALALSVFTVAASAAEVEEEPAAAEVEVETSGDGKTFMFDSGSWNSSRMYFYIWDATSNMFATKNGWQADNPWGSKKLAGTPVEGQEGVFESYEVDIDDSHNVFVIFNDPDTNAQTYDCVLNTSCYGDTAYMTGNSLENPVDSEKTAIEAVFTNSSSCGPYRQITSTGNIVGSCSAPNDDPAAQVAKFIYDYNGSVDKITGAEVCTTETVTNAMNTFGTNAEAVWAKYQELYSGAEDYESKKDAAMKVLGITEGGSDKDSDSGNTGSTASTASGTSGGTTTKTTTTTTKTTTSGSAAGSTDTSTTATGDTTGTVAFAVVLLVAALAIVAARKKVQD